MKAMLLAAGFGTRLKPWTNAHPKALARVNGKSLLQWNIEYLQSFNITEVIVNVHHFADQVTEAVLQNKGWGSKVSISHEQEILETGGGLKKAAWFFNNTREFVLMNADILTDLPLDGMIGFHNQHKTLATLAVTSRISSRYLLFDENLLLCGWKNTKTEEEKIIRSSAYLQPKAFSGVHVINTELLALLHRQGKFSMIDVYLDLCSNFSIGAFDHSDSKFIDVGKPESLMIAEHLFADSQSVL